MSALSAAQARVDGALERLERAVRASPGTTGAPSPLARDCEALRLECDDLRQKLAAADRRSQQLGAIVTQVEDRIDGAIRRVDELTGTGGAP
jgi:hypothetical protein